VFFIFSSKKKQGLKIEKRAGFHGITATPTHRDETAMNGAQFH
jgi:hypothetical protein